MIGLDNAGATPCLVAEDVLRLQRALAAGASVREVAAGLGVHWRTVYRYRHAKVHTATVDGHLLHFIVWRPGAWPQPLSTRGQYNRRLGVPS